ncbi:head GIN domain-containing protein [Ulvibacterium marinum]|uniref:head GIN domain-containing protein n=1 Tax=Ulvibacterium marinum TaxID=2419782 RepID=UPI00249433F1|nr:head GIN domain-containing protein [Ulvibacterium marinum]
MKKLTTLITLTLCIMMTYAQRSKKVKGNGHVVTVERTTSDFDGISASGFYDIELIDGEEGQLTLEGEENILDNIETEVKRGTLVIRSKDNKHLIPSRGEGVFITVSVDEIDKIRLSGSGDFIGKKTLRTHDMDIQVSGAKHIDLTIDATDITIATSGSSNIDLKGNSEELTIRSSGSSNVKAYGLEVDDTTLELSGSSDVEVTVNESLTSRVSGSGNIQYRGNPDKVFNQISGSGSVSKN